MTWDLFTSTAAAREGILSREPSPVAPRTWSVSEVNEMAGGAMQRAFPPLWITGEVANFTRARSGHCYFSLRDEESQLRCVLWRGQAVLLPVDPEEGMSVRVFGRLGIYRQRGEFQLVADRLEAEGEGLWKIAFDRLRARLHGEGLLEPARKRTPPRFPACVGVVTSPTGAAVRDILSVIRRRAPWTEVVLSGCRVQGVRAAEDVVRAFHRLLEHAEVDVVIIGRGGGSVEDLQAFNEEVVARAVAESPVPVISAVGHETDLCISDLVADLRAPTPSAAAEAAVPDLRAVRAEMRELVRRAGKAAELRVGDGHRDASRLGEEMRVAMRRRVERKRERFSTLVRRMEALSPLSTLARGYAVPRADGRTLRTVDDFTRNLPFQLRVADGTVDCRVDGPPEEHNSS